MANKGDKIICSHSGKVLKDTKNNTITINKGARGVIIESSKRSIIASFKGKKVKILENHLDNSSKDEVFACFLSNKQPEDLLKENKRVFLSKKSLNEYGCENNNFLPNKDVDYGKLQDKVKDSKKNLKDNKPKDNKDNLDLNEFDPVIETDEDISLPLKIEEAKTIRSLIKRIESLSNKKVKLIKTK